MFKSKRENVKLQALLARHARQETGGTRSVEGMLQKEQSQDPFIRSLQYLTTGAVRSGPRKRPLSAHAVTPAHLPATPFPAAQACATLLHAASEHGSVDCVGTLLRAGMLVDSRDAVRANSGFHASARI